MNVNEEEPVKKSLIFHGGFCRVAVPKIIKSRYTKDFGDGFYCTKIQVQAEKWARKNETPVVSVFEYNDFTDVEYCDFAEMTDEWLDFIVSCRNGTKHNFDIVSGAMADDQIWNYIADFADGIISREQFWVLARFKYPTHQIVFCTDKSLKKLKFVESYEVN
ncbi:hypothetical protein FACS1894120_4930 [Clostridia bacterium]|nr:hypothetical protein FACS1894120_4930 [Clostridia bacterium]